MPDYPEVMVENKEIILKLGEKRATLTIDDAEDLMNELQSALDEAQEEEE